MTRGAPPEDLAAPTAAATAAAVRAGRLSARQACEAALARIAARDGRLNSVSAVLTASALGEADRVDATIAAGRDPGPLAGVPFAVKNLFDVAGVTTLAGSRINAERPPAARDAAAVAALRAAGAVLVGTLAMDEYAAGFTCENSHYGPTRNPHDPSRVPGGSSGGSGAAVAAGLVPLALGSDTNGSIRVPAALCGVFGLKPTYGRLSRRGVALFAASLDHVGPLARSARDLALAYDAMLGPDPEDPACTPRPPEPATPGLGTGLGGVRVAVAVDHFARGGEPEVFAAVDEVARALGATRRVTIPEAARGRAAAMVITAAEGSNLHLDDLRRRADDFDPLTRDRFLVGALLPGACYVQAQRFRRWYRDRVRELFGEVDVILAPTTPCVAPPIGPDTITVAGEVVPKRRILGLYTQALTLLGVPVVSVPVVRPGRLPLGVQLIGAPWTEPLLLRVAAQLEAEGVVAAPVARGDRA